MSGHLKLSDIKPGKFHHLYILVLSTFKRNEIPRHPLSILDIHSSADIIFLDETYSYFYNVVFSIFPMEKETKYFSITVYVKFCFKLFQIFVKYMHLHKLIWIFMRKKIFRWFLKKKLKIDIWRKMHSNLFLKESETIAVILRDTSRITWRFEKLRLCTLRVT